MLNIEVVADQVVSATSRKQFVELLDAVSSSVSSEVRGKWLRVLVKHSELGALQREWLVGWMSADDVVWAARVMPSKLWPSELLLEMAAFSDAAALAIVSGPGSWNEDVLVALMFHQWAPVRVRVLGSVLKVVRPPSVELVDMWVDAVQFRDDDGVPIQGIDVLGDGDGQDRVDRVVLFAEGLARAFGVDQARFKLSAVELVAAVGVPVSGVRVSKLKEEFRDAVLCVEDSSATRGCDEELVGRLDAAVAGLRELQRDGVWNVSSLEWPDQLVFVDSDAQLDDVLRNIVADEFPDEVSVLPHVLKRLADWLPASSSEMVDKFGWKGTLRLLVGSYRPTVDRADSSKKTVRLFSPGFTDATLGAVAQLLSHPELRDAVDLPFGVNRWLLSHEWFVLGDGAGVMVDALNVDDRAVRTQLLTRWLTAVEYEVRGSLEPSMVPIVAANVASSGVTMSQLADVLAADPVGLQMPCANVTAKALLLVCDDDPLKVVSALLAAELRVT